MQTDKTVYIIDFDRTLLNVGKVMELAEAVSLELGIDFADIKKKSKETEGTGWSYSPLEAIKQADISKFEAFKRLFVDRADKSKLLYDDGQRFLAKLKDAGKPYMILTYATDDKWQELKLRATGLDEIPHYVTKNMIKSKDITDWVQKDGTIAPPVQGINPAKEAWLIDDRGRVFDGLPGSCKGFYLKRDDSADVLDVPLAEGTRQISSFDQIVDRI